MNGLKKCIKNVKISFRLISNTFLFRKQDLIKNKKMVLGFVVEKNLKEEGRRKKKVGVEENNEEIILDILNFFK